MPLDSEIVYAQLRALGQETYDMYKDGKVLRHVPDIMREDEVVQGITAGTISRKGWLFVITNQRILLLTKGFFRKFKYQEIAIEHIDSVHALPGLMFEKVQLVVRGVQIVIQCIIKGDAPKIAALLGKLMQGESVVSEEEENESPASGQSS